ncbi:NAD(P)/FAD-dependent oxidoreductase [Algicella marina]|uniref:Thioredoxin reductase n=1 Tax=Algicella marina TaxID=2683284 RepID=A0A6P1SUL0_9RHOB|nr:NAD(P)/FAD-dependent oxidoreductase [Algicella marina]QHQ34128.1 FAD-binding protein [Algicella marina]
MQHDVIVVGGSYAGMAAALQLLRARRTVLVIDAGERRNRFAAQSHGFLGQDGADPAAIAREALAQLERYPTLEWIDGIADAAAGERDDFVVKAGPAEHSARRIIFATGVKDGLPDVPGLADRWGRSVFHCPYCHGYELNRGRIGVIGAGPGSIHQAQIVAEWGPLTYFPNGLAEVTGEEKADLSRRGADVETGRIAAIEGIADVRLMDGRVLQFAGLFTAPVCSPATPVAEVLGCALDETGMGTHLRTDGMKETSVPGAYACGDVGRVPHSVSLAVGDGAWCGAMVHRSLVF